MTKWLWRFVAYLGFLGAQCIVIFPTADSWSDAFRALGLVAIITAIIGLAALMLDKGFSTLRSPSK
jgi:hypothetical protein